MRTKRPGHTAASLPRQIFVLVTMVMGFGVGVVMSHGLMIMMYDSDGDDDDHEEALYDTRTVYRQHGDPRELAAVMA